MTITRLTLVWNADFSLSGGVRALAEAARGAHSCTLCAIAYHRVTQTVGWKAYMAELKQTLGVEIRQPCRDQLKKIERDVADGDFPAVLAHTGAGVVRLLDSKTIAACGGDLEKFRGELDAAIKRTRSGEHPAAKAQSSP